MEIVSFVLNLPYTLVGLLTAAVSFPKKIGVRADPSHIVIDIKWWWWAIAWMKGARAATIGHVILLGDKTQEKDYEHELVHVRQYKKYPLIFPVLYYTELVRKGYRQNRFEDEAYRLSGNKYNAV